MAKQEKKRKESGERGGYIRPMIYPELRSQPEQYRGQRRHGYPHERKLALKGGGGILREILSSQIRTKSGGACSIGTRKGVSGSGSPRDRNGVENGGRKDATFLWPPFAI